MERVKTGVLDVAYEAGGPPGGPVLLLLHGCPDDAQGWREVASRLHTAGYRTLAPYWRGCGPTRFLSADTVRDGQAVALTQDVIDLADALGLERFGVVGHDWGARVAYTLAALFPDRVSRIAALALAYQPRGEFTLPSFGQSRLFWYQWFMCLDAGPEAVRADPKGFARIQWDTWSPPGWFEEATFEATARSFGNPDWVDITLNAYRARWHPEPSDPRYDGLRARLKSVETLSTPTLMIQGGADTCDAPADSEGQERFFTGPYQRLVLNGVGHFPAREAPDTVATTLAAYFGQ